MHHVNAQARHHLDMLYRQAEAARATRLAHPRRAHWWRLTLAGWRVTLVVAPERRVLR